MGEVRSIVCLHGIGVKEPVKLLSACIKGLADALLLYVPFLTNNWFSLHFSYLLFGDDLEVCNVI